MIEKVLNNKFIQLFGFFLTFLVLGTVLIKAVFAGNIFIGENFHMFFHMFSGFVFLYIVTKLIKEKLIQNNRFYVKNMILKLSIISLIGVLLYYVFDLNFANYLLVLFIFSSLVFSFDSKISFSIAFILLFYVVFYIVLGDEKKAEIISVYTYYFLLLGLILEIVYIFFKMDNNELLSKNNKEKMLLSNEDKKGIL